MVEYKNLLSQFFSIQPQQQWIMPGGGGGGVYSSSPSVTFERHEFNNNNLSEHSRFDNDGYPEIVWYWAHVYEEWLIINIDTIFRHKDRQSEKIEISHRRYFNRLADARLEPDKNKIISNLYYILPEVRKKSVKSWTKKSAHIVAIEMPSNADVKHCFEITSTNKNHWAARAKIKE